MTGRNVTLTDYLANFIDQQVETGRHQNASEVVREALRRYDHDLSFETERIASIREVIREGREAIARGEFRLIATEADTQALFERLTRQPA